MKQTIIYFQRNLPVIFQTHFSKDKVVAAVWEILQPPIKRTKMSTLKWGHFKKKGLSSKNIIHPPNGSCHLKIQDSCPDSASLFEKRHPGVLRGDLFFFSRKRRKKKSSSTVKVGKIIHSKVWDGDIYVSSLDSSWGLHLFHEDAYDGIIIWGCLKQEPQIFHSFHHNFDWEEPMFG